MSHKVLSGYLKGRSLKSAAGPLARPTTSIMRKSVFDICQGAIEEATFLDLFACSGAMGIEAISRGAAKATFIEKDRKTFQVLKTNIENLNITDKAHLILGDALSVINRLNTSYDIIYIDPPYPLMETALNPIESLLVKLSKSSLLKSSCRVFLEERAPGVFDWNQIPLENLKYEKTRQFGSSLLHQLIKST